MAENIHPIFDTMLQTSDKETLLKQRGVVIWMTGLSGSGKSTIARAVERRLHEQGHLSMLLDGDNLRVGLNKNLGFSAEDRQENIRRVAETAKLFAGNATVTLCSFVSPTKDIRATAKEIVGEQRFFEVYVNAPFDVCAQRDVKGLYKKAMNGEIKNFTGLDAPFDAPENPFLEIKTDQESLEESVQTLTEAILNIIKLQS